MVLTQWSSTWRGFSKGRRPYHLAQAQKISDAFEDWHWHAVRLPVSYVFGEKNKKKDIVVSVGKIIMVFVLCELRRENLNFKCCSSNPKYLSCVNARVWGGSPPHTLVGPTPSSSFAPANSVLNGSDRDYLF